MKGIFLACSVGILLTLSGCKLLESSSEYDNRGYKDSSYSKSGIFTDSEKRMIFDYYSNHGSGKPTKVKPLPKGLQKKYQRTGQLPPGWQKKIARGEVMPGDIYDRGRSIPYELGRRLPVGPVGSKIIEIEGKIIRVIHNTRQILDILSL